MPIINDVNITPREFDIIACLLNSRGTKKIAEFLNISTRTAEAHLQNIMLKINCNSKEGIIDFLEKSCEYSRIKTHYLALLLQVNFELQLKKIAYFVRKLNISCIIDYSYVNNNSTLTLLINHLKLAGINVCDTVIENNNAFIIYPISKLTTSTISLEEIVKKHILKHENLNLFFLAFDENTYKIIVEIPDIKVIDFYNKDRYHFTVFKILILLVPNIDFSRQVSAFKKINNNIMNGNTNDILCTLGISIAKPIKSVENNNDKLLNVLEQKLDSILYKTSEMITQVVNRQEANRRTLLIILTGIICLTCLIIMFSLLLLLM